MVAGTDDPNQPRGSKVKKHKTAAERRRQRAAMLMREKFKEAADHVCDVACEILDEIIAPTVGIEAFYADIFVAEPRLYLSDKKRLAAKQRKKIITKVAKRYGGDEYALARVWDQPLALFAVVAMSRTSYTSSTGDGKIRKHTAKDAWEHLAYCDKILTKSRRAEKAEKR
jgi:hypothetical protein